MIILFILYIAFTPYQNETSDKQYDLDKRRSKPVEGIDNITVLNISAISNQTDITLNQNSIEKTLDNS